jgi:hypothetical protein
MRNSTSVMLVLAMTMAGARGARGAEPQPSPQIDRQAFEHLKRMSDFLDNLKGFRVDGQSSLDVVLESGQKVQYNARSLVDVSRPRLRSTRVGPFADLLFLYDGRRFVLHDRLRNLYAVSEAPEGLDQALTDARERLDLQAPGTDLLYAKPHLGLMEDVTELQYLGMEAVGGVRTHHLAARKQDVDWQLWIEDGPQPFPRKYVITTTSLPQAPQFEVLLYNWNAKPSFEEGTFSFQPPAGAQRIEFLEQPQASDRTQGGQR